MEPSENEKDFCTNAECDCGVEKTSAAKKALEELEKRSDVVLDDVEIIFQAMVKKGKHEDDYRDDHNYKDFRRRTLTLSRRDASEILDKFQAIIREYEGE